MNRNRLLFPAFLLAAFALPGWTQGNDFAPVTEEMLRNPDPADWLMLSRTYDEQRHSPLDQINRQNVGQLRMVWARGMSAGVQESVPLVYRGVMYVVSPGAYVQALDAASGDLLWEYRRKYADDVTAERQQSARAKGLAIFEDMIYYTAPDGYLVAIDARTGKQRWEAEAHDRRSGAQHTSAPIVVEGKVITGRVCADSREECFIAAHDARTGALAWKFYTTAAPGEPGGDSWGSVPVNERIAGTWGLPGSYDPVRRLIYWAVANPKPYTRLRRHGSADG
ncbi:MAG TPA: PQQ-binding-like beta-propeller repeat protein, partial [Terriglobia bacterium]|nr:PQQ-binding-like beta-propeller repeat protein [Terriglobia bacterium]